MADGRDRWVNTSPVGSFDPNGFNLLDMSGNVYEWVADWYDKDYYGKSPDKDPGGPRTGEERVGRGGSYFYRPRYLRLSFRVPFDPGRRFNVIGFRCVGEVIP